ncbi:type II secretion system protein [Candidatus Chlamydia sanziniae]|uniref:Uncharacterized protein n=1 Tax=Candidatus Chlamydia sanziniae TaxID=1806891 RepID=A0A1A9HUF4_9CHLA|nr:type II secretion system protein [Candidatus Chlamydia sanziniae]ANH78619.1 hypothetical protein Cs308_0448 [Candidatus Chlamydia sanziniae]
MALSLVCIVLMPCIRFYYNMHRSFEDDIFNLQLPSIIDNCFFAVEEKMHKQMEEGEFPSSGVGGTLFVAYTSRGNPYPIPYSYSIDIRKGMRVENNTVKACLADVVIELFPNQKQAVSVQRCMCVIL